MPADASLTPQTMKSILKSLSWILLIPFAHLSAALLCPDFVRVELPYVLLIYGILTVLTIAHLIVVRVIVSRHRQQAPMIVMALNMLKMLLSVVLLFVVVVPFTGKDAAVGINFAVAYVFFLIFDSQIVILMMKE